jgi:hypothetical protein
VGVSGISGQGYVVTISFLIQIYKLLLSYYVVALGSPTITLKNKVLPTFFIREQILLLSDGNFCSYSTVSFHGALIVILW